MNEVKDVLGGLPMHLQVFLVLGEEELGLLPPWQVSLKVRFMRGRMEVGSLNERRGIEGWRALTR